MNSPTERQKMALRHSTYGIWMFAETATACPHETKIASQLAHLDSHLAHFRALIEFLFRGDTKDYHVFDVAIGGEWDQALSARHSTTVSDERNSFEIMWKTISQKLSHISLKRIDDHVNNSWNLHSHVTALKPFLESYLDIASKIFSEPELVHLITRVRSSLAGSATIDKSFFVGSSSGIIASMNCVS